MKVSVKQINRMDIIIAENEQIKIEIAPELGGKITSIFNKTLKKEFLWQNKNTELKPSLPGDDYDSCFWGGIDELIPNDIPEEIDSIKYPDHGELWTTTLKYELKDDHISLSGDLKLSGLYYRKDIFMDAGSPIIHMRYKIRNCSTGNRSFLWKLHAALAIGEGDRLITDAKKARVVDPDYSRFRNLNEFNWPIIEKTDASIIPVKNKSVDFFYLYDNQQPEMNFLMQDGKYQFKYTYDKKIFPYQWYFASYGGFYNHFTAILEPCSSMPISVNEAKSNNSCTFLAPGQGINTLVSIYAGENIK